MDFLISYLKILVEKRKKMGKNLKIIFLVNSNFEKLYDFFGKEEKVNFLEILEKKEEKIEIFYTTKKIDDFFEKGLKTIFQIFLCEKKGDILFFLPNFKNCLKMKKKMILLIEQYEEVLKDIIIIVIGKKSDENEKKKIFKKNFKNLRKIIFCTEIAENSFFIDNISYIIDSGIITKKIFNFEKKIKIKKNFIISSKKAEIRKNLLKSKKNGKIFRLYTEEIFLEKMSKSKYLQIQNSEISKMLLFLKKMEIFDLQNFEFFEKPFLKQINFGIENLKFLGALKKNGNLSEIGNLMSFFPLNPKLAKMLIKSKKLGVSKEILNGLCLYLTPNFLLDKNKGIIFDKNEDFEQKNRNCFFENFSKNENSDFFILSEIITNYEISKKKVDFCKKKNLDQKKIEFALKIKWRLKQILFNSKIFFTAEEEFSHLDKKQKILLSILSGFKKNVAFLTNSKIYKIYNSDIKVKICEKSVLKENTKFFVFLERKENCVKICSEIESFMIGILFPRFFNSSSIFKKDFKIEE